MKEVTNTPPLYGKVQEIVTDVYVFEVMGATGASGTRAAI
jgi:hypothetical protein